MIVRDAEDHIAWLLEHGWHEKALAAVEAGQGRSELLDEVFLTFWSLFVCFVIYLSEGSNLSKMIRKVTVCIMYQNHTYMYVR